MLFTLFGNEYTISKQQISICKQELGVVTEANNEISQLVYIYANMKENGNWKSKDLLQSHHFQTVQPLFQYHTFQDQQTQQLSNLHPSFFYIRNLIQKVNQRKQNIKRFYDQQRFDIIHLDPLLRSSTISENKRDVVRIFRKCVKLVVCLRRFFIKPNYSRMELLTESDIEVIIKAVTSETSSPETLITYKVVQSIFEEMGLDINNNQMHLPDLFEFLSKKVNQQNNNWKPQEINGKIFWVNAVEGLAQEKCIFSMEINHIIGKKWDQKVIEQKKILGKEIHSQLKQQQERKKQIQQVVENLVISVQNKDQRRISVNQNLKLDDDLQELIKRVLDGDQTQPELSNKKEDQLSQIKDFAIKLVYMIEKEQNPVQISKSQFLSKIQRNPYRRFSQSKIELEKFASERETDEIKIMIEHTQAQLQDQHNFISKLLNMQVENPKLEQNNNDDIRKKKQKNKLKRLKANRNAKGKNQPKSRSVQLKSNQPGISSIQNTTQSPYKQQEAKSMLVRKGIQEGRAGILGYQKEEKVVSFDEVTKQKMGTIKKPLFNNEMSNSQKIGFSLNAGKRFAMNRSMSKLPDRQAALIEQVPEHQNLEAESKPLQQLPLSKAKNGMSLLVFQQVNRNMRTSEKVSRFLVEMRRKNKQEQPKKVETIMERSSHKEELSTQVETVRHISQMPVKALENFRQLFQQPTTQFQFPGIQNSRQRSVTLNPILKMKSIHQDYNVSQGEIKDGEILGQIGLIVSETLKERKTTIEFNQSESNLEIILPKIREELIHEAVSNELIFSLVFEMINLMKIGTQELYLYSKQKEIRKLKLMVKKEIEVKLTKLLENLY